MFDPQKLMDMMKQAYQMQQQMQDELRAKTVTGSAGGGMVSVTMNAQFEVSEVKIEPSLVQMNDHAFLEDMVRAAMNDATRNAREAAASQMKTLSQKMGLPT
jgi:DNA-binding YbaB/EbfC family protein